MRAYCTLQRKVEENRDNGIILKTGRIIYIFAIETARRRRQPLIKADINCSIQIDSYNLLVVVYCSLEVRDELLLALLNFYVCFVRGAFKRKKRFAALTTRR